jgi:hypothetical protein
VIQSTTVSVPNRNTMSAISAAKELMVIEISTGRFLYRHTYPVAVSTSESSPLKATTCRNRLSRDRLGFLSGVPNRTSFELHLPAEMSAWCSAVDLQRALASWRLGSLRDELLHGDR